MIANIFASIFIITARIKYTESRSFSLQENDQWEVLCKDGFFASAIQTWYIEASSGERFPSAVRITCRNPSDPKDMQQVQAFDTKSSPWQESRSCRLDEQIVGLNLWPSIREDISSRTQEWNPQIICREQRQQTRLIRAKRLSTSHATCKAGHALCGVHGKLIHVESETMPSFKNYGIKCCQLPKKIISIKPSLNSPHRNKSPESQIFKITIGPPGSNLRRPQRKPKNKPTFRNPSIKSRDFVLKLNIIPKEKDNEEPIILVEEKLTDKERKILLISTRNDQHPFSPAAQDEFGPHPIVPKKSDSENNLKDLEDKMRMNQPRDADSESGFLEVANQGLNNEPKEMAEEILLEGKVNLILDVLKKERIGHPTIDSNKANVESRPIKMNTFAETATGPKSSIFEDNVIVDTLSSDKSKTQSLPKDRDAITASGDKEHSMGKPILVSADELLDIEIISSGIGPISEADEAIGDYEFVPVYLVKKRGKLYRKSKCLWPKTLPLRNYEDSIDADLEVAEVRSGRHLIPVLLIKVHEGTPSSSRECFWPRVKSGRQIDGRSNLKPEYIVLTP